MKHLLFISFLCLTMLIGRSHTKSYFALKDDGVVDVWLVFTDSITLYNVENIPYRVENPVTEGIGVSVKFHSYGMWEIVQWYDYAIEDDKQSDIFNGCLIESKYLGLSSRNYDGSDFNIYALPTADSQIIGTFNEETPMHPLEIKGEWCRVQVYGETDENGEFINYTKIVMEGWAKFEDLCGHPVTNC